MQLIPLTKVFAELFSKSDRVPRRYTNNPELAKSRKFSYLTAPYAAFFFQKSKYRCRVMYRLRNTKK